MKIKYKINKDFFVEECSKPFDFNFNGDIITEIPEFTLPVDFNILLIVGPSGSGKSIILNQIGKEDIVEWGYDKSVCSHFETPEDASERLSAVGLNSIPSWVKPYHILSTGEKFRADLARKLKNNAVIDEFTSVVDRKVAVSASFAVQRYIRNKNIKNVVFASCHYDIIEWLNPDYVFDTQTGQMLGRGLERRPEIKLEVLPCSTKAWSIFSKHHYLSGDINKSSRCWLVLWEEEVVGFTSILAFPNGNFKNAWREHRTVILPDFQGLGIGVRVSDAIGKIIVQNGGRFFSKTSHSRMGEYRESSYLWKPTSKNKKNRKDYEYSKKTKEDKYKHKHSRRVCYSHEYISMENT
jgi:ABC-type lipoprotein export system ATPase subunit